MHKRGGDNVKNICFRTIMLKGEAGGTITKIEKTATALNVDTYTIYINDGTTSTFEVTNGTSIESIEKTGTSGYTDTYTITLTDGSTQTFDVENGRDGAPGYEVPAGAVVYFDSSAAIPEGYEASADPELPRLPHSIYMGSVSVSFENGEGYVSLSTLGLSGKTLHSVVATPIYQEPIRANCYVTVIWSSSTIAFYLRDGINQGLPTDGTYNIAVFIAYS